MTLSKRLLSFVNSEAIAHTFLVEKAKLAFALALDRRRKNAGLTGSDIATAIGASPAYVSKVFRGDSNFTIDTMVKLAGACGGRLEIQIVDAEVAAQTWANVVRQQHQLNEVVKGRWESYLSYPVGNGITVPGSIDNAWIANDERYALAA